nr:elongation factor 2-like [Tanacetum cinerariifolium]
GEDLGGKGLSPAMRKDESSKMDRCFLELEVADDEEAYLMLKKKDLKTPRVRWEQKSLGEKELMGNHLMKLVMKKWLLPASTALLEMCIFNLPSPHEAQRYRVENLYKGSREDDYQGIRNCDPGAPLMLYVSKMIPTHVKGPNSVPGHIGTVKKTAIWMGKKLVQMGSVLYGNTVVVYGLDGWILKNETLTFKGRDHAHPIRAMKLSVSPFVIVVVNCNDPLLLPEEMGLAIKIWDFGPEASGPNMLFEAYKGGGDYLDQLKGSLAAGFKKA